MKVVIATYLCQLFENAIRKIMSHSILPILNKSEIQIRNSQTTCFDLTHNNIELTQFTDRFCVQG